MESSRPYHTRAQKRFQGLPARLRKDAIRWRQRDKFYLSELGVGVLLEVREKKGPRAYNEIWEEELLFKECPGASITTRHVLRDTSEDD